MGAKARLTARWAGRVLAAGAVVLLVGIGIGPLTNRYRVATVLSASMTPTFPAGAVVISTPVPATGVGVGDVISFHAPVGDRMVVTHRVVEVVTAGARPVVRTRGDAAGAADPWLARLDDRGPVWRARLAVPKLGYLIHALRQPLVHRLLVLLAPALFLGLTLARIWCRPVPQAAGT